MSPHDPHEYLMEVEPSPKKKPDVEVTDGYGEESELHSIFNPFECDYVPWREGVRAMESLLLSLALVVVFEGNPGYQCIFGGVAFGRFMWKVEEMVASSGKEE